jgi:hypothetical protein
VTNVPKTRVKKRCLSCGEEIYRDASICVKCRSPQNWTRHVFQWTGVGAAAAALIPLWAGAWSLWQLIAVTQRADVAVVAFACGPASIRIAADNSGQQAAMLLAAKLRILHNEQEDAHHFSLRFDAAKSVVEPKKTTFFDLAIQSGGVDVIDLPNFRQAGASCKYELSIAIQDFRGLQTEKKTLCECPS